jgi:hypothetical protein
MRTHSSFVIALCAAFHLLSALSPARAAAPECNKGVLWPFVREAGDCLTDIERQQGRTGVYRQDELVPAPATDNAVVTPALPSAVSAPSDPPAVLPANAPLPANTPPPAVEEGCRKGLLWPFVREAGDCLTDIERQQGRSGTY